MYNIDFEHIGYRIKQERRRVGITQEELGEDIGKTKAYIGFIERGERRPTVVDLINIANRFGITTDILIADYLDEDSDIMHEFKIMVSKQPLSRKKMAIKVLRDIFEYFNDEEVDRDE